MSGGAVAHSSVSARQSRRCDRCSVSRSKTEIWSLLVPTGSRPFKKGSIGALQRVSCGAAAIGSQPGRPWRIRSAFLTGVTVPRSLRACLIQLWRCLARARGASEIPESGPSPLIVSNREGGPDPWLNQARRPGRDNGLFFGLSRLRPASANRPATPRWSISL
jgi:hypothetical protein